MMKTFTLMCIACGMLALTACGERDQSLANKRGSKDEPAWKGAHNEFVAKGWTTGDKTAWENQIRVRGQSQNEYVKTN